MALEETLLRVLPAPAPSLARGGGGGGGCCWLAGGAAGEERSPAAFIIPIPQAADRAAASGQRARDAASLAACLSGSRSPAPQVRRGSGSRSPGCLADNRYDTAGRPGGCSRGGEGAAGRPAGEQEELLLMPANEWAARTPRERVGPAGARAPAPGLSDRPGRRRGVGTGRRPQRFTQPGGEEGERVPGQRRRGDLAGGRSRATPA